MEEVKAREEEYETIKSVQSRMKGLPDGFVLASRKRRLLGQGVMHRVQFSEKDFPSATSSSANSRNGNTHPPSTSSPPMPNIAKLFPVTLTPSSQPPYSARSATHPVPGLPANTASSAHTRPDSTVSDSGASCYSDSSASSDRPSYSHRPSLPSSFASFTMLPGNPRANLARADSIASSCPSSVDAYNSGYPSRFVPSLPNGGSSVESGAEVAGGLGKGGGVALGTARVKTKETPVHVFVFSDLVILAIRSTVTTTTPTPASSSVSNKNGRRRSSVAGSPSGGGADSAGGATSGGGSTTRRNSVSGAATKEVHWEVLKSIGICKVVGVLDQSGKAGSSHVSFHLFFELLTADQHLPTHSDRVLL
jgi:hypothetical protein